MGASGTTTVDFGAFPGSAHARATITGQSGILTSSLVEAWLYPLDTAEHTADEHKVVPMRVIADPSSIIAGTGFSIDVFFSGTAPLPEPQALALQTPGAGRDRLGPARAPGTGAVATGSMRTHGRWTIAFVWN